MSKLSLANRLHARFCFSKIALVTTGTQHFATQAGLFVKDCNASYDALRSAALGRRQTTTEPKDKDHS